MSEKPIRELDQIRGNCARKLEPIEISPMFRAILGCLLNEDWTTPRIEELRLTQDQCLPARVAGEATFKSTFLAAEANLIRNIHGVAGVAELDGDEVGFLLGEVASLKRIE